MSVTGRPLTRGFFAREFNGAIVSIFSFQFNPSRVTRSHSANYVRPQAPGSPVPLAHFSSINSTSIKLELLLDAAENFSEEQHGVLAQQAELESYCELELDDFLLDESVGAFISPPRIHYAMGSQVFPVTMDGVVFKDERWGRQGDVTRSRASISMTFSPADLAALRTRFASLSRLRDLVTLNS